MDSSVLGIILLEAKKKLNKSGVSEYALDAELIMMKVTGLSRIEVLTNNDFILTEKQNNEFFEKIQRRMNKEPIAYILGCREFMGLDFYVEKGVLIPRPDTEILVEAVLETIKNYDEKVSVAEVGAGSGCISISLAKFGNAECYCTDINHTAVELSFRNANLNKVENSVHFYDGDVFNGLPSDMKFDIIVSNPPYIRKNDMNSLMRDVREYEPENALCGGEDGLDFYRIISADGKRLLNDGGYIFYEIGYDEADEVRKILADNGYNDICVKKDLSGLDRVVMAHMED